MQISQLIKLFNAHKVDYVIIGASAFPAHGWARVTLDTDFFIRPTPENAQRAYRALCEFGYDLTSISAEQLLQKKTLIRGYTVESDIHPYVAGVEDFDMIWDRRIEGRYENEITYFADLDSLITMKEAAARPKDQEDLKYLRELKKQQADES